MKIRYSVGPHNDVRVEIECSAEEMMDCPIDRIIGGDADTFRLIVRPTILEVTGATALDAETS